MATISATPDSGCYGDIITVAGSGFSASSPLTVTLNGIHCVFSAPTSNGSGNVSGTFPIPPTVFASGGRVVTLEVMDAGGHGATFDLSICCDRASDTLTAPAQFGPTFTFSLPVTSLNFLDYIHHDGAHWVAMATQGAASLSTTFPPDTSWKPIIVYKIPDDGSSITSYEVDLNYSFTFAKPANAASFVSQHTDPTCGVNEILWHHKWFFQRWAKPVLDARLASDGTNLWLAVLTKETIPYQWLSGDMSSVDLATLTSGYTSFVTSISGVFGDYIQTRRRSVGLLSFCHSSAYPVSDGGDAFSTNWSPPNVVMFTSSGGGFTRIGSMDAKYCPGLATGGDNTCTSIVQAGPRGGFFSGISVAASDADPGTCHLVWSEGGDWGTYGLGASAGGCYSGPLVWDGRAPNRDYRIGYTTWDTGTKLSEDDLFSAHIDRTNWNFTYASTPYGYTWPDTADFAVSNCFQVRNDTGTPVLFIAAAQTSHWADAPGSDTGWMDNKPWYAEPTISLYNITGGSLTLIDQITGALLPNGTEVPDAPNAVDAIASTDAGRSPVFAPLAALSVSDAYADPLLADAGVYLPAVVFINDAVPGSESAAIYRIKADLSGSFDFLDGMRYPSYSIFTDTGPVEAARRFVSEPNNVWATPRLGPNQLDRECLAIWTNYNWLFGTGTISASNAYVADDGLYAVGRSAGAGVQPQYLVRFDICRECQSCACDISTGLHIWQRF